VAAAAAVLAAVVLMGGAPVGEAVVVRRGGQGPRLVAFLDTKAKELSSVELTVLAHSAAGATRSPDGSMDKVKDMIKQMLDQKQADLAASTTQNEYCQKELPKAKADLKKLKEDEDERSASHDKLEAKQAQLSEDASNLAAEVAQTRKNLTEAEAIRDKEQAVYAKVKAQYEQDLRNHREVDEAKQIQTATEETDLDLNFRRLKRQALESIQQKEQDAKHIQAEVIKLKVEMSELERDSGLQRDVMDSAKSYKEQLDKQCIVRTDSYEERKRRRDRVMDSMKDAYVILGGDA